jgi:hypothetical protein
MMTMFEPMVSSWLPSVMSMPVFSPKPQYR